MPYLTCKLRKYCHCLPGHGTYINGKWIAHLLPCILGCGSWTNAELKTFFILQTYEVAAYPGQGRYGGVAGCPRYRRSCSRASGRLWRVRWKTPWTQSHWDSCCGTAGAENKQTHSSVTAGAENTQTHSSVTAGAENTQTHSSVTAGTENTQFVAQLIWHCCNV